MQSVDLDLPTVSPQPPAPDRWQRAPLDIDEAEAQVARAVAMLDGVTPLPLLRWYFAAQPTLIRGVFQAPEEINVAACAARGIPVVRRRSGGTGVLAGPHLLSLDIALPPGHRLAPPDVTEAYHWLGQAWLTTLERLGVRTARLVSVEEVRAAPYRPARHLSPGTPVSDEALVRRACFGALSPYEVAVGPRKLVGLSQVRRRGGVLFQVGLPLVWEADLLAALLAHTPDEQARLARLLRARALGLADVLPTVPPYPQIIAAFEDVLATNYNVTLAEEAQT
jgi:lipoate-protein ligase A